MSDLVREVSGDDFETEVLDAERPVVVDFWAPWCAPCRIVAPEVEKLAESSEGEVKFVKLNIDNNREIALRYGVMSIPTIARFERGSVTHQTVGAKSAADLGRDLGLV